MIRIAFCSILACMISLAGAAPGASTEGKTLRIVLAGDSTVTDSHGWGGAIGAYFNDDVVILNHAAGGRSSKSYINEGRLAKALASKPDYLFIQFGHNDCPGKGPKRETDPDTTYRTWMTKYVTGARKVGARPVFITSVERRCFDKNGKTTGSLNRYAQAVIELGKQLNVPVIDLHKRSVELYERLGEAKCHELEPKGDRTHFNKKGAKVIAGLIAEEIPGSVPALAPYLKQQD